MHHPKYLLGGLGITLATWVEFSRAREVPSSDEFPCRAPADRLCPLLGITRNDLTLFLGIIRPTLLVSRHHSTDLALFLGIVRSKNSLFRGITREHEVHSQERA
jgi:hypothetical protein